ncbi:DNA repair protein RecO [Salidesulfovibrio onnuriiensis]|uniref:DNA repair protein RecO n=1 Tax=Salidesulfovibrio onnuriiensis TaxID=2583823 RepID=UPI0011CB2806|nr:DNA repair protein RecO [Salidesulfovibrio onnuriiensis]
MEATEKALVLKVGRFREADAWVRLLTASRGVFTAFAFGGFRSRRRFLGCLDPLNLVLFTIGTDRKGAYQQLAEGSLLNGFKELKADSALLGQAANCIKFVEAIEPGQEDGRAVFDLLLETLETLERKRPAGDLFPILFRAKAAFELGFTPDLSRCTGCGTSLDETIRVTFSVENGQIACGACKSPEKPVDGLARQVSVGTLRTLDWIMRSGPSDWVGLGMAGEVRRQVFELVELFIAYHLGLQWEGGNYKKV